MTGDNKSCTLVDHSLKDLKLTNFIVMVFRKRSVSQNVAIYQSRVIPSVRKVVFGLQSAIMQNCSNSSCCVFISRSAVALAAARMTLGGNERASF